MKKKKAELPQVPAVSSDFDVEDIRAIREYNSLRHARMTPEEIVSETRELTAEAVEWLVRNNESENGVRVISAGDIENNAPRAPASSRGVLSSYAEPSRLPEEDGAWEQAAAEKHLLSASVPEPYYRLKLDDPATPGFISSDKDYYGTKRDLLVFAGRLETAGSYPETASAILAYFNGDKAATHHICYHDIPVLTPACVLKKERFAYGGGHWTHLNAWLCPYVIRCDEIAGERITLICEEKRFTCIRATLANLVSYNAEKRSSLPLYEENWMWGNSENLLVKRRADGVYTLQSLLYVPECFSDDVGVDLKSNYPLADYRLLIDDILGNG